MPVVRIITNINAPIELCFDLARSIDFHKQSISKSQETAIGGVQTGLIGLGQEVTWRARHFGLWQTLTSRITVYDRPDHFRDSMVNGAFRFFDHDHHFRRDGQHTIMEDVFAFASPLRFLGKLVDRLVLTRYMRSLLTERAEHLRTAAESDEWRTYLGNPYAYQSGG